MLEVTIYVSNYKLDVRRYVRSFERALDCLLVLLQEMTCVASSVILDYKYTLSAQG